MEKSEMMKRYEAETGMCCAYDTLYEWDFSLTDNYIAWLEAKAEAYDRLMSGGKKTLKEWANILGKPIAVDVKGRPWWFPKKPEIGLVAWIWYDGHFGGFGEELPKNLIAYTGDWKDSLTLPD